MARFGVADADKYGGTSSGNWFGLADHGDTARVRIMYESVEDIEGVAVHEVEVRGNKRYVECLKEIGMTEDACPLCAAGYKQIAKVFVPIYDIEAQEFKWWDRGKSIIGSLASLISRYNPLVSYVTEIERDGKKRDTSTKYLFFPGDKDDTMLDDLPEIPELIGSTNCVVISKTADEMADFIDNGGWPEDEEDEQPAPRRRERNVEKRPTSSAARSRREREVSTDDDGENEAPPERTGRAGRGRARG